MRTVRWVLLILLPVFGLLLIVSWRAPREVPIPELRRRCEAVSPPWNEYMETIKSIGAGPVAQWSGRPVSISIADGAIALTVEMALPWREWDVALPVLLKTPEGAVLHHARHEKQGDKMVYHFPHRGAETAFFPPWIELQYPHQRERLFVDSEGQWRAPKPALSTPE